MDKAPLSQLIRIGAKLRKQASTWTIDERGRTCAIGAAYMAKFGEDPPTFVGSCCDALGIEDYLRREIVYRNDIQLKTREEIAAWLEGQGL